MLIILLFLTIGTLLGFLLRRNKKFINTTDKITTLSIYLLLFLLGISVGSNQVIIKTIGNLGVKAFIISISGIIGSVLVSYFVYRYFFIYKQ